MKTGTLIVVTLSLACATKVQAQYLSLNRIGRHLGCGWSDGYHAGLDCQPCAIGQRAVAPVNLPALPGSRQPAAGLAFVHPLPVPAPEKTQKTRRGPVYPSTGVPAIDRQRIGNAPTSPDAEVLPEGTAYPTTSLPGPSEQLPLMPIPLTPESHPATATASGSNEQRQTFSVLVHHSSRWRP